MANQDFSINPLLAELNPQPDDTRRYLVLLAYVSAVTDQTVTVYTDLDLSCYMEIPYDEIQWAEKAIPGLASSPTKLVINAAAKIKRVTTSGNVEVGFLSGMIAATCLPTSVAGTIVKVLVENNPVASTGACPPPLGQYVAKGTGMMSHCIHTGLCISDPPLHAY